MKSIQRILSLTFAALLVASGAAAWYVYLHYSDPDTVRQLVLAWVAQAAPKATVDIESAEASLFQGVALRQCTLAARENPVDQFLSFEAIRVFPDHRRLVEGKLHVRRVTLVRPVLQLKQCSDGTWNVAQLLTGKKIRFPSETNVTLENARIEIFSPKSPEKPVILDGIAGLVRLRPEGEATWQLYAQHELAKRILIEGRADTVKQELHVTARTVEPIDIAGLKSALPDALTDSFRDCEDIAGQVELELAGSGRKAGEQFVWDGSVAAELRHASLRNPHLPYPLREGEARLVARREGLTVSSARFTLGSGVVELKAEMPRWDSEHFSIVGAIKNVELTQAVRNVLDSRLKSTWDRFQPTGFADIDAKIVRVGDELALAGKAQVRDATFKFEKFAYPVRNVTGWAELRDDGAIVYELRGQGGSADLEIVGRTDAGPPPAGLSATIRGRGASLDEVFLQALPPAAVQVIRDLHPGATNGDFVCQIERLPGDQRVQWIVESDLRSSECTWAGLPYRLTDIAGHLSVEPGRISFRDVSAVAGQGRVRIQGTTFTQTDGAHTEVGIQADNLLLDDHLLASLPEEPRRALLNLRPQGTVSITGNAVRAPGQPMYLEMRLDPAGASIEPTVFPYRLEGFEGVVYYRDNRVEWDKLTARHGDTVVQASGAYSTADGVGTLELRNLESDSVLYDRALQQAAPPSLRRTLDFLSPSNAVSLRFPSVAIRWTNNAERRDWTIDLEGGIGMRGASLIPAVGLHNVNGTLWYEGRCDNDVPQFRGNFSLQSMEVEGFQAQNVKSSFTIDGARVELANIRGDMYGGQIHGAIRAQTGEESAYECRMNVYGAKLGDYIDSRGNGGPRADGMVYLDLFLEGTGDNIGRLHGRGKLDVLDADVDRLPILQDLFRIGNLQAPCGKAFEEVNCDFRVEDRIVHIETLDLLGPAGIIGPSFNLFSDGEGTLNVDNWDLDLAVSARWGRGRLRVPVLTPSFNLASDQVWSFNVTGRLDEPQITPAPLKGFLRMFDASDNGEYARRRRFR